MEVALLPAALESRIDRSGPVPDYAPNLGPCWLWTRSITVDGYGRLNVRGRQFSAHRLTYEALVGPIPDGLYLDHLCRVKHCVNPAHLEPVTNYENLMRGYGAMAQNARKTHCPSGHPYSGDNLAFTTRGTRRCRACARQRAIDWHYENRELALERMRAYGQRRKAAK